MVDCAAVADYARDAARRGLSPPPGLHLLRAGPGPDQGRTSANTALNRVVVASCSPRLHEPTFRKCVSEAGLNPYLMEMANIREQCSWVHTPRPGGGHRKGQGPGPVRRGPGPPAGRPRGDWRCRCEPATLVIGGGVAGIQAALDLADAGYQVILVEKQPSIGGIMAQLDKTYPDHGLLHMNTRSEDDGCRSASQHHATDPERGQGSHGLRGQLPGPGPQAGPLREREASAPPAATAPQVCPVVVPDEFNMGLEFPPGHLLALSPGRPVGLRRRHRALPGPQPDRLRQVHRGVREAVHRLRHERRGADLRGGHHHRRHRHGGLRPDRAGRIRLHPPRERGHQPGVRTADQRRRADAGPRHPPDRPEDAPSRSPSSSASARAPSGGASPTAPTSAA